MSRLPASVDPTASPAPGSDPVQPEARAARLVLGGTAYDLRHRALVMGILNRTPDSFSERGRYFALDDLLRRAEQIAAEGADILDVGGVRAGPGPEVPLADELERVVPTVAALTARFDLPVSVDTWSAEVAEAAFAAGACLGNDISGFADPGYLEAAARAGAGVVATHIRLAPRVPDPDPHYGDVVAAVAVRLAELAQRARAAGIPAESVVVDAGLDLGKSPRHSLELLRASERLAGLGHPLLLSASNKTFLGEVLGLAVEDRRDASLAAAAVGVSGGVRIVRAHDVVGTRRVCDALAAVAESAGSGSDFAACRGAASRAATSDVAASLAAGSARG